MPNKGVLFSESDGLGRGGCHHKKSGNGLKITCV